jgi:VCBS repeat protein/PASTA domain-containing protein
MKALGRHIPMAVAAGALVLASAAAASSPKVPTFAAARDYAAGEGPSAIAAGDLNGDGAADLVVSDNADQQCPSAIAVLLNRGGAGLAEPVTYPTGDNCVLALAIGDFNRDGRQDIVAANWWDPEYGPGTVSLLLNAGNGTFRPGGDAYASPGLASVAVADVNGDGAPDVVTGSGESESCADVTTVGVLLNDGHGSLGVANSYQAGDCPEVAVGDVSGDGKPDLVTANSESNSISVLVNNGDGTFAPKRDSPAQGPGEVAIGDIDGDGKADLATANMIDSGDAVEALFNQGDGTFLQKTYARDGIPAGSVSIHDLNGDGKPDLAYVNEDESVSVLVNRGGRRFLPKVVYIDRGQGDPISLAVTNLDGNGRPDLAVTNSATSTVSVFSNTPGLCDVQYVKGQTLKSAKQSLARGGCRVGRVHRAYARVKRGLVISQKPKFGTVRPGGAKVDLVVSKGRHT